MSFTKEYQSAFYEHNYSSDFDIGRYLLILGDNNLSLLLLLKNGWGLTEAGVQQSDITFTTNWYDNNIVMPQISITPVDNVKTISEVGNQPLYKNQDMFYINVWVRPDSDSGKSLGSAKRKSYMIKREIDRIFRSGSHVTDGYAYQEFAFRGPWRAKDELNLRPIILRDVIRVFSNYYKESSEVY